MKLYFLLLCVVCSNSLETMYMKESGIADLTSSASGYIYQHTAGQPYSYIQFTNPVLKPLVHYARPIAYETQQGNSYKELENSAQGEKGNSGYENKHGYEKGEKGQHEKEGEQKKYEEKGGQKNAHHDSAENYEENHSEAKGSKGGNFEESGYHKKGQKTTGFHKVYHKDEYKKDHTFYDEKDHKGSFQKYGNGHNGFNKETGGFHKGGHHESGYRDANAAKKGFLDRGRAAVEAKGHKAEEGAESYYNNQAQFAKKQGEDGQSEYGFSEKDE